MRAGPARRDDELSRLLPRALVADPVVSAAWRGGDVFHRPPLVEGGGESLLRRERVPLVPARARRSACFVCAFTRRPRLSADSVPMGHAGRDAIVGGHSEFRRRLGLSARSAFLRDGSCRYF